MTYLSRIKKAFETVIGAPATAMTMDSTMDDVTGWDSSNFIDLVLAVEDEFDIEMPTIEATALTSVKAIDEYLCRRLGN